jgi:hypothetical protein
MVAWQISTLIPGISILATCSFISSFQLIEKNARIFYGQLLRHTVIVWSRAHWHWLLKRRDWTVSISSLLRCFMGRQYLFILLSLAIKSIPCSYLGILEQIFAHFSLVLRICIQKLGQCLTVICDSTWIGILRAFRRRKLRLLLICFSVWG